MHSLGGITYECGTLCARNFIQSRDVYILSYSSRLRRSSRSACRAVRWFKPQLSPTFMKPSYDDCTHSVAHVLAPSHMTKLCNDCNPRQRKFERATCYYLQVHEQMRFTCESLRSTYLSMHRVCTSLVQRLTLSLSTKRKILVNVNFLYFEKFKIEVEGKYEKFTV